MTQPPDNDLKALWKGQETETKPMSVDAIRARAARYTNKLRWIFLFGFTLMLAEILIFGRYALTLPTMASRIGMLAILVGLGWMIARFTIRWPGRLPDAKASGGSVLEFHRAELQRQRETFTDLLIMVGPMLLGIVIFVVATMFARPHPSVINSAPILAMIALWLVGAWWLARRGERRRQQRLKEIDATRVE